MLPIWHRSLRLLLCELTLWDEVKSDFSPTILERRVLHSVGAVSLVSDVGVCVGARGADDVNLHMISSNLGEGASVNNEVGCDFSEDP